MNTTAKGSRRSFIGTASATVFAVLSGIGASIGIKPLTASAGGADGCCGLYYPHGAYCGYYCQQQSHLGWRMRYWVCNNTCKCWECTKGSSCWNGPFACSSYSGSSCFS
jgi:hypothetical protein